MAVTRARRDPPLPRRDPVVRHGDPGRVHLEQLGDLGAHRGRAGDHRVGPVGQPPLHRVHLARERRRQPARVAARLGGVERGHERHVERVGQRDRRVGDQPVVGVHDVRPPRPEPGERRRAASRAPWRGSRPPGRARTPGAAGPRRRPAPAPRRRPSRASGGSSASVPVGRRASTTTSCPAAASAVARACACLPEPADHDRRVLPGEHQHPHRGRLAARISRAPRRPR